MKTRLLTGSKDEIAKKVAQINGEVREAIIFIEEQSPPSKIPADIFAEMEPFTVHQPGVQDSREAIYEPTENE